MAEPDPGSALSTSFSHTTTPNHNTSPLPRIRFPDQFLAASSHGESSRSSMGSPGLPTTPITPDAKDPGDRKGHLVSKDVTPGILPEISPSKRFSSRSAELRRRSKRMSQSKGLSALKDPFVAEFEPSAFSDEYDLYPKILQDVQRALELQSRRRDRKSFTPSQPTVIEGQTLAELRQDTSFQHSPPTSPQTFTHPHTPLDIDFSPSVQAVPLHPVPVSSNGGATLDWTGSQSDEERFEKRWTLSKRKGKDRASSSNKAVLEKQDTLFADRISRIRSKAKQPTFRKAAIVSDQLGRRYSLVYNSLSNEDPINLAKAARWYAGSDPGAQAWLDSAEPLTWLKHLLDKHGGRRSKRHLSALIVEEYIKSDRIDSSLAFSRDDSTSARGGSLPSDVSLSIPSYPFHPIRSSPSLHHSLGDSLRRIRSSDGQISFEPRIDSTRSSIDGDYKSGDEKNRGLRHVLPALVDAAHSITSTTSPYRRQSSPGGLSPTSSRHFPFAQRIRRRQVESDEGSSSVIHSQSDDYSGSLTGISGHRRKRRDRRQPHAPSSYLQSPRESGTETNAPGETSDVHEATSAPVEDPLPSELASEHGVEPLPNKLESEVSATPPRVIPRQRLIHRMSLPVPDVAKREQQKQREEAGEEELEHEYEMKSQMLDDLKAQNHRVRQKLQRIAAEVREYDNLQAKLANTHGIPRRGLPPELLEAFNQDPSSVTGGTRERKGWRAVEDVHNRILRQQQIFKMYLSVADKEVVPDSLLDEPISSLMDTLSELGHKREALAHKQLEVASALAKVKSLHTQVKKEYNNALSRTSLAYPELSQIIALEESYKDQYQHIWEFGMDALTFILDNVAPVWRNYGRTIGEDITEFLIIPWYRNEFTGEPKRYDIASFPRRSIRHWFALFFLFLFTLVITYLQMRAAIFCTFMYRHPWIDNSGFRWLIMPCIWIAFIIHWSAVFFEVCIVFLQLKVVGWWLGWSMGLLT
ncbi:hypothetical protein DEU56DRAFT_906787 [Suillus clintonianus]|uniref:uncharacterized protein n=1 Tax=Suillus clintonianus TaxID=1904413 RepID=UPI001B86DF71|nr:uncharacterized protein DEU56DRAFT_906787 [Suillus clintonianus]KAG2155602.1 hypothetical protein DEU56DRAFT_906787 [Suillus clintonianus]